MIKLLIFFSIFAIGYSYSQEESFPCNSGNAELKNLFTEGILEDLYIHSCFGPGLDAVATSFLKASGTAPKTHVDPSGNEPDEDTEYVAWTCKYAPGNIGDGSSNSTWVEGVKGYGIGEGVIVPCLDLKKPVEIWIGYGKSNKLYKSNSRPSKVRLIVVKAELGDVGQYGEFYKNLEVVEIDTISLKDTNAYQTISIPEYTIETYHNKLMDTEKAYKYFLGIEILAVYKGEKWDDTCISEVRNKPKK